ncbi:MAG: TonB-dependent receptor [Acidobacteria bacterium]|nr:TonB-dependent receptor [Acidobacteriota bacterium]
MRRILRVFAVLAAIGVAMPAAAQVQTGSILVKATDQQNAVMPGVIITISSPVLVAGSMTGVTDAGGVYRFPSLVPGTYTVKLDLSGFQTLVREGIIVVVGQTTPLELTLRVASVAETITVAGSSPTVDTTSANVNVNLSEALIQGTPGGRDIWALVEAKVPGLVISRPDVGGTSGGLQGVFSARGTTSAQNTSFLNGINVGDPAAIGAAGFYYDIDAFDDIQISTGAHDITVPTSGVFLNMVTKSGGNKWQGGPTVTWTGQQVQARNDHNPDLQKYGFRPDGNTSDFVSDINFSSGGPLVQNKLRFFGSFRDWRVHQNVPVQNSQSVLDQTNITSGLANLTWQLNQNNKLTGFYSRQRYSKPNRLLLNATNTVPDSTSDEEDMFDLIQGQWNTIVGKNFFVDARLGLNKILFPTFQNGGNQQSTTDTATGIVYGNFPTDTIRNRDRYQANATGQYYVDQALGGRHEFKFGFDYTHAVTQNQNRRVDDVTTTYTSASGAFAPLNVQLRRDPQRGEVEHRRPSRQRGLRRHGRRTDGGQGVRRTVLLHPVDGRRRREQRESQRELQRDVRLERPERQSQVRSRRADGPGRRQRGRRERADPDVDRSELQPTVHRRVHVLGRSRAHGEPQAECDLYLSAGEEPAVVPEPRQSVRDDADVGGRPGHRRRRGHGRRRHVWVLPAALYGQQLRHHQRSERAAELQGARGYGDQAALEPVDDAGRLHAVQESDQ